MISNVEEEKLAIFINLIIFFQNLSIRNMFLHKYGVKKRKEKRKRDDNERR